MHACDRIANDVLALTSLAIVEALMLAVLIALVVMLTATPQGAKRLREWIAAAKNWAA